MALTYEAEVILLRPIKTPTQEDVMRIFGKSFSEYVRFNKIILWLIVIVGLGRLALSLGGVPNSAAKWVSITGATLIGLVYASIRVHTSGFGSYKQLLPLIWVQTALAHLIVAGSIVLGIVTHKDNIFTAPEYSGNADGKTWLHVGAHLIAGFVAAPLVGWIIGSLILFVTKKVAPRKAEPETERAAAAGA